MPSRRQNLRMACLLVAGMSLCLTAGTPSIAQTDPADTIAKVKPSIVAVGTFQRTRNPQFAFSGTGFMVEDGSIVVTNAHVLPATVNNEQLETLAIALPSPTGGTAVELRKGVAVGIDRNHDLALVQIDGARLPALQIRDSTGVREGDSYLFTGFPLGVMLGLIPTTHRAMVSALTPIAIPTNRSSDLDAKTVRRLKTDPYPVLQLDGTAYPGNSGSPLYDQSTGEVVGIINMVYVKGTKESAMSQPSGISYAIPSGALLNLLRAAKQQ